MNDLKQILTLLSADSPSATSVLGYAQTLAETLGKPLTILARSDPATEALLAKLQTDGTLKDPENELVRVGKRMVPEVIQRLGSDCSSMVIFDEVQRLALFRQTSFSRLCRLMEHLCAPLIEVQYPHWPIQSILLCSGGLPYSIRLEKIVMQMAQSLGAKVRLLHVIAPVTREYKLANEIHTHWQDFLEMDTAQSEHLRNALRYAQNLGVDATFRVKHGPVRDMIEEELKMNEYQLAAMGSTYSSTSLTRLYRADMTALIASTLKIPLLTIRGSEDDVYE